MSGPDMTEDEINELARELAELTLTEYTDAEYENCMDVLFAEHEAMMYAAHSYDLDAQAYGEM